MARKIGRFQVNASDVEFEFPEDASPDITEDLPASTLAEMAAGRDALARVAANAELVRIQNTPKEEVHAKEAPPNE